MNVFNPGPRPLDHVAVVVRSLAEASSIYQLMTGHPGSNVETLDQQGVRVCFHGSTELIEPLGPDTTVGRFLARNGPGLHHIAYRSSNLEEDLRSLAAAGIELIDDHPRPGALGHQVAFLHPRSTGGVLIELVQHAANPVV